MWRSISSTRSSLTRHLWRSNLHNKVTPLPFSSSSSSSSSQVLNKTLYPSFQSSNLTNPTKFPHQNHIFLCYSSVSEFETEPHDPTSSSEELESENNTDFEGTHVGNTSAEVVGSPDFDSSGENNDTQMSVLSLNDGGMVVDGFSEGLGAKLDGEKLEKVLSLLQSSVDECLEGKLDGMELDVDEEFVVKVVTTPFVSGENLTRFFKWCRGKKEFVPTSSVLDVFAGVICGVPKRKNVYDLWDLVKEIGEKDKGIVNGSVLNQLISALSEMGKGKAAFEVFEKFEEFGCVRNGDTYYLTIEVLCKRAFYDWAILVCKKMVDSGVLPESEKVGEIISSFCKGRREKEAHIVYLLAKGEDKYPPQKAVNFLVSCLSKEDDTVHLAQEMLVDFSDEARKYGINPFSWVIRGLCRKNDTEGAKKLLLEMMEKGPIPGNAVFNSVINSLSKVGELDDAKEMLKVMESRGLKPDVYTYSVIMSGYAKGGAMEEACKVLAEAKKKHRKLCPVTFHTLIRGYCKLGEFDKALKLLSEMKDYGVDANVDEYNKMIQSLCLKALDWETAEKLLEEMKQKGLHLPGITRGLIRAVKELEQEAIVSDDAIDKA